MRLDSGMSLQQEVGWTRDMLRMARYLAEVQDDPFIVCSLENIGDEFTNWNAMFPAIKPTFYVGANPLVEVQQYLNQLGVEFHVKNKNDIVSVNQLDDTSCNAVYSCSTKLGSAIKAAVAAGIQQFYVDSVREMDKIKKVSPSARIIVEVSVEENCSDDDSLGSASGVRCCDLDNIIQEAARLGLEIAGVAVNINAVDCLDHDENLIKVKNGLKIAEAAVNIAKERQIDVKTLHLGQLCRSAVNVPNCIVNTINNILSNDIFSNIIITADASQFLVSSSVTLASKIIKAQMQNLPEESMNYFINENIFGAFSANLTTSECCITSPLPLGGGGNRKGLSNKLMDTGIFGDTGDVDTDIVLPIGDILLPKMNDGDWLLFPNMGAMNLGDYAAVTRKMVGVKSFICVKKMENNKVSGSGNLNKICDNSAAAFNIDLDSHNMNQNCNSGVGLKGEIDLRKTFIYED